MTGTNALSANLGAIHSSARTSGMGFVGGGSINASINGSMIRTHVKLRTGSGCMYGKRNMAQQNVNPSSDSHAVLKCP